MLNKAAATTGLESHSDPGLEQAWELGLGKPTRLSVDQQTALEGSEGIKPATPRSERNQAGEG